MWSKLSFSACEIQIVLILIKIVGQQEKVRQSAQVNLCLTQMHVLWNTLSASCIPVIKLSHYRNCRFKLMRWVWLFMWDRNSTSHHILSSKKLQFLFIAALGNFDLKFILWGHWSTSDKNSLMSEIIVHRSRTRRSVNGVQQAAVSWELRVWHMIYIINIETVRSLICSHFV